MITQNPGASIGACGWRTIRPMIFVAIAYVVIVIPAAAALVGADKGEGGLGHVKRRAVTLIWPLAG
jgi:hypothetical protein